MNDQLVKPQDGDLSHARRVLLVDDDEKLLQAFQLYLSQTIDVDVACSGADGLELLQAGRYSVVISDMQMPKMTGVEFIRQARMVEPDATYVLLTASRETETAVEAYNKAKVFCVVNKPCGLQDLSEFVQAAQADYEKRC